MSARPVIDAEKYIREYEAKKGTPTPDEKRNYVDAMTLMASIQLLAVGSAAAAKLVGMLGSAHAQSIRPGPDAIEFQYIVRGTGRSG